MKVAFLNCTDELNPEAGSELTCVFLDKIPGTIEFCKRLKLNFTTASTGSRCLSLSATITASAWNIQAAAFS